MARFEGRPYDIHRDGVPDAQPPSTPPPGLYARQLIDLATTRDGLVLFLLDKVKTGDFRAVQDAASDIREVDAMIGLLTELRG